MTKLICHRKELYELQKLTNNFHNIGDCKSLADYLKLIKKAPLPDGYTQYETKGLIFGEPLLNYWLVEQGPANGIEWDRYATRDEDYLGIDFFARERDSEQLIAGNHKFFNGGQQVSKEHLTGLAMGTYDRTARPMLVTTTTDISIPARAWLIDEASGIVLTGDRIESTTQNAIFWQSFADYLRDNVTLWHQKELADLAKADAIANRPLDSWQAADLAVLTQKDRGVFIAPPGSGKTTIEAKLSEQWMKDKPGPVIVISRVKSLTGQVLKNLVECNSLHPDRIACYSDHDHEMDLKDPLSVGTLKESETAIANCYQTNRNVYIGAVSNHGATELLEWHLDKKIPVRIIVDELAEIIPGDDGALKNPDKTDKTTIDVLYQLNEAGLLDKCFGFDAVWKFGPYKGMNDDTLWGQTEPVVKHTQDEMTYTHNVLVPVHICYLKITQAMIDAVDAKNLDKKRRVEIAGNIAAMNHQLLRKSQGIQSIAKAIVFASGGQIARFTRAEMDKILGNDLELNEVILAATSLEQRKQVLAKMADTNTGTGCISNYDIWTKGMDVPDLTATIMGFGRNPSPEKLVHIIGRATRRASGERGLPIVDANHELTGNLKKKPEGIMYVCYEEDEINGGEGYQHIVELHKKLYEVGIIKVKQSFITASTSKTSKEKDALLGTNFDCFEEIKQDEIDRIKIEEAIQNLSTTLEEREANRKFLEERRSHRKSIWENLDD